ncbi:small capsid protein [Elephant endotheliotropic herpesvirus 1A]|uniref:Small capsomere-interacting protein n=1 Tax=Elephant endotheliotropic herpesvirus 1A TaxID=759753 RepID=M1R9Y1_ELHV1|nr:small capsid protein [Elephant endotheliotropic herpesvirus 1A]QEY96059.1 small capsid protein [Elephant endotheliotropic herpesvirus 1A]
MSNSSVAQTGPAQAGRGQRNAQDRTEEERKLQFLRHFNLEQAGLLNHEAVIMFRDKYYQRRQPFSASEESGLRLELLRLFSNIRQDT